MNIGNGLLLLVLETSTETSRLGNLYTILVAQLVSLLHQLLHLLHDHLVLLLILLLARLLRLLLLLVARREIGLLLLLRLLWRIIPRVGNVFTAHGTSSASLLLCLTGSLF